MTQTWFLFRHLMKTDLRESHGIASLILFAIATVYAVYQVVQGRPDPSTWNAMAWGQSSASPFLGRQPL